MTRRKHIVAVVFVMVGAACGRVGYVNSLRDATTQIDSAEDQLDAATGSDSSTTDAAFDTPPDFASIDAAPSLDVSRNVDASPASDVAANDVPANDDATNSDLADASVSTDVADASVTVDAGVPFVPSLVGSVLNVFNRGSAAIQIGDVPTRTLVTFDGDTGAITRCTPACTTSGPFIRMPTATNTLSDEVWFQNNIVNPGHPLGRRIALFAFRSLDLPAGYELRVIGSRPVVLVAGETMRIEGAVSAGWSAFGPGPGGMTGGAGVGLRGEPSSGLFLACSGEAGSYASGYSGGGAGGGFGSAGGRGAVHRMTASVSFPGNPIGDSLFVPFMGGCGGGAGGGRVGGSAPGLGGDGGGALALIAGRYIELESTGAISSNGGPAGGGGAQSNGDACGGGGGGGAGGSILIETLELRHRTSAAFGEVFANGGGGGGSGAGLMAGFSGSVPLTALTRVPGGSSADMGNGGDGRSGDTMFSGDGRRGSSGDCGGGGGGGVGRITIRTRTPLNCTSGSPEITLSPVAGLEGTLDPAPTVCRILP